MLLILDTSSILALLLSKHKNYMGDIIRLGYQEKLLFGRSDETYKELIKKIAAQKIKTSRYYDERKVGQFIAWYKHTTKKFPHKKAKLDITSRDPKDNIFLSLALASQANYLISVDRDLLTLKKIGKTKIVTPAKFIEEYKK